MPINVLFLNLMLFVLLPVGTDLSGQKKDSFTNPHQSDSVKIDRIEIEGNWMAWNWMIQV